jgi:hypothetical protein
MKKYYLLCMMLFAACINSGFAQTVSTQKGLTTVVFNLPAGIIKVYLPDDIRPGDMISGSVLSVPSGKNGKQTAKNLAALKKYVIEFNGQKISIAEAATGFQCNMDKSMQPLRTLNLMNGNGENAGLVNIQSANNEKTQQAPAECKIPTHALTAAPLKIMGSFDGNSSNTNCTFGGQSCEVIAESVWFCIIQIPADAKGIKTLEVKEKNKPACSQKISGVEMNVTAGKTNLLKGEKTFFDVKLTGLRGLAGMALLTLDNVTTNTVTMLPANNVIIPLNPDSVEDGNYNGHFNIQSINNGRFTINVNLDLADAAKDIYTDLPGTNNDTKADTVPCKDQEGKVKLAEEALEKLKTELAGIDSRINYLQNRLDDCNKVLAGLLSAYHAKKKVFDDRDNTRKNWEKSGKKMNEENQKKFDKAQEEKDAAAKEWSDQNNKCNALKAELAVLKARKAALPGLIATGEGELKGAKDELEKCKTKAAADKKKKEDEEKRKTETQPQPAGGGINPGTGADKEGSPCNPDGLELVEPVKRIYGSCYVKETEITPCNTDRISNELLEAIKKAFEKFKKLSGPLEIAEKVASCATTSKAICVNVHVVRNWEDVELTYICVKGKWVLKNRKVTGRGEDDYGWYIVKDKEVGNLCCWVFGKKEDAENAMEAHLKEAIQDVLDRCK